MFKFAQLLILIVFISFQSFAVRNTDTLAIVGNKVITVEDFQSLYKEKVAKLGLTDNGDTRYKYLMNLVNDELLIQYAKQKGLDKTEKAKSELQRIYTQELLNAFTTKHITPTINITEDDLIDLYVKMNTKIKVSHIYAQTKEKADSLYDELINGAKFEKLAEENFDDPVLRKNYGSLGYITIDETDPAFEKAAYSMGIGEISKPVKTVQGYSIIRVEDIKQNPLYTENEYLKSRDKLKTFARKRAFEDSAKSFSQKLHEQLDVKFNDEFINKLFKSIRQKSITSLIETNFLISENDLNETVVTSKLGRWDLATLIERMSSSTETQIKWIRTEENLRDFISGIINRSYIVKQAEKEKLHTIPSVREKIDHNFGTYLLTEVEDRLKGQINIPVHSVKSYYEKNLDLFKTEPEIRLSSILLDNKTLADSIKILLESGEKFENLAEEFSIQRLTARLGGDLGYYKMNELDNLGEKVFALNAGEWIGPISEFGKTVFLKCTGFRKSITKSFEEVRTEIENNLASLEYLKVREEFADSLKNTIHLKLFPDKLNNLSLLTKVEQR